MVILTDSLGLYRNTTKNVDHIQKELAKTQKQISSGYLYDSYFDLSKRGILEDTESIKNSLHTLNNYTSNNSIVLNRLEITESIISNITDIMSQFSNQITTKMSANNVSFDVSAIAKAALSQIGDSLNVNFGGIYLFGGTNNTVAPVSNLLQHSNIINNTNTYNYYKGDNSDIYVNISSGMEIKVNIRANEQAFIDAIAALNLAIQGQKLADKSLISQSFETTKIALDELISLRSQVRSNVISVSQVQDYHYDMIEYLEQNLSEYMTTDLPKASIKLNSDSNLLMASFQTFARLSRLSLVDYL